MKLYAVPGAHNVIDTIVDATGLTAVNGETFEQVRERYPTATLYTWEEWQAIQMERQHTPITWEPTTAERYREMLEILPPAFWRLGLFLVGEPMDHDYANGASVPPFASIGGRIMYGNYILDSPARSGVYFSCWLAMTPKQRAARSAANNEGDLICLPPATPPQTRSSPN